MQKRTLCLRNSLFDKNTFWATFEIEINLPHNPSEINALTKFVVEEFYYENCNTISVQLYVLQCKP